MKSAEAPRTLVTIRTKHLLAPLVAGLLAAAALAGCADEGLGPAAIAKAADATVATRGMRIAIEQTVTLPGAGRLTTRGGGLLDTHGQISHLTLRAVGAPDVVVGAFDRNDGSTEVIIDHRTVYTHSPQLSQLLGAGRTWLKIEAAQLARAAGIDLSALAQAGQDPGQVVRQLGAVSGDVKRIGIERVRGVITTRYRATVDLRRFPDLVPRRARAAARASIDQLIEETGASTVPVDVWVGRDDLVRRLEQTLSLHAPGGPTSIEQRFEFYDFGTKVDIRLPPAGEVTSVSDLVDLPAEATRGP